MKINFDELAQLQQKSFSIYTVTSDEPLLLDETIRYLKKLAQKRGYEECHSLQLNAQSHWEQLREHSQSLSLFNEKKIIDLDLPTGAPGKQGAETLIDYAKQPPHDVMLLLRLPKLTLTQQKSKWFTEIERAGVLIPIPNMTSDYYPQWLKRRAVRAELLLSNDAIAYLAELTEGNLLAAKQSIEKLKLLYGSKPLTVAELETVLGESSYYDIYTLLDATLSSSTERSLKILAQLNAYGVEPTLIVWIYAKELRHLAVLAHAQQAQRLTAQVWQDLGIWQQRRPLLLAHLKRHTYAQYLDCIQQLGELDCICKGAIVGDAWDNLASFIVRFTL